MKAVLMSIQPKWCELIASGKKTVEVRKTKPKLEVPFKAYIYCTMGKSPKDILTFANYDKGEYVGDYLANGKVIGEFVCNEIENLTERDLFDGMDEISNSRIENYSCVDIDELLRYKGSKNEIYGWHISNLVIYDKPRELVEFRKDVKDRCTFNEDGVCLDRNQNHVILCEHMDCCQKEIKRPPQSWCYCEEVNDGT